jgi:Ca-activated chloride channel homolog
MNKFNFRLVGSFFAVVMLATFAASAFLTSAQQQNNQNSNNQRPRQASPQTTPPPRTTPTVTPTPPEGQVIEDDEPIRVESDNVLLSVRVVDRTGRIVADVRPEEFKVFEDGIPQPIESVSKEDVPINYGLVVDNSGSLRNQLEKVIEASKIIINANKSQDQAFVVRFVSSDKIEILQEFTSSKQDLTDAVENFFPEGGQTAIIDAVMLAAEKASEHEKGKRLEDKTRRALVLITDGADVASYYKIEELFKTLRESDVQIYPIGFVNDLSKDDGGFIKKSTRDKAVKLLERMALETGGKAYFPQTINELPDIANAINNELRTQYSIAYAPTNDKRDGTFRAIKVTIADDAKRGRRIPVTKNGRTAPKN